MKKQNSKGIVVVMILLTIFMIATAMIYVLDLSTANHRTASQESARVNAQFAADSGLDIAIQKLNADENWSGQSETTLYQDTRQKSTYEISVSNGATSSKKVIQATARVYIPASASTPLVTRKYQLDVSAVTSGIGITSVVSGVGGLQLNNNAKITGGDVAVNGTIQVDNNAQIGLSTTDYINHPEQVVNVRAAHTSCPNPVDATYPRACTNGEFGQPITITNNGKIYADVKATNQTTGTNMSRPGLTPNQTVTPYTMPDYDRAAQKAAVSTTVASSDSSISCGNNQTKTWPANVKITGDVSTGNNCTVTVSGNVWITGRVSMGNGTKFVVANSLGTTRPTMMIDGQNGIDFGNNNSIQQNSSSTGMYVLTYWCGGTCSPDTNPVTGPTLSAVQSTQTINMGNNSSAPGSILYARWSKVRIQNNGSIGAIAGQTVELSNNAVINFTASVPGSSNLTKSWAKRGYLRVYN